MTVRRHAEKLEVLRRAQRLFRAHAAKAATADAMTEARAQSLLLEQIEEDLESLNRRLVQEARGTSIARN